MLFPLFIKKNQNNKNNKTTITDAGILSTGQLAGSSGALPAHCLTWSAANLAHVAWAISLTEFSARLLYASSGIRMWRRSRHFSLSKRSRVVFLPLLMDMNQFLHLTRLATRI